MVRFGRILNSLILAVLVIVLALCAAQCKPVKDTDGKKNGEGNGNGDVAFHGDDGDASATAPVKADESLLADIGVEEVLGQFAVEGCYVLPHPEDWNGFAVFLGAKEGLAIYPSLLEPGDPAYEKAKTELRRLLDRHASSSENGDSPDEYFDALGNIMMDELDENVQRSINKYLEIIMFDTVADAQRAPAAYENFFQMIGEKLEPNSVWVYRNYSLFNMNYWSKEKSDRYKQIFKDFVDSEMKREKDPAAVAVDPPDLTDANISKESVKAPEDLSKSAEAETE